MNHIDELCRILKILGGSPSMYERDRAMFEQLGLWKKCTPVFGLEMTRTIVR
jgi:hypothetical protein